MSCYFWCQYFKTDINVNKNHYLVFTCENVLNKELGRTNMSFNVVRLSLLQVMMVVGLFSFGKQVLALFLVHDEYDKLHIGVSTVGHHYCPIAC
jgi:hypothetical protein